MQRPWDNVLASLVFLITVSWAHNRTPLLMAPLWLLLSLQMQRRGAAMEGEGHMAYRA